jgi:hypothetical protein
MNKIITSLFVFILTVFLFSDREALAASYIVRDGDTMVSLEKKVHLSETQIREMNKSLSLFKLYEGEEIVYVDSNDIKWAFYYLSSEYNRTNPDTDKEYKNKIDKAIKDLYDGIRYGFKEEMGLMYYDCLEYAKRGRELKNQKN